MQILTQKLKDKGWVETTLGEVCIFNYGKALRTEKRIFGNIPVYGSSGITGWHNESLINEKGLIIGRKGSVGTIYKSEIPFFPIDTVFYITQKDAKCDLEYLYRLLQSLGLDKKNSDSAVPGLNRENAYSTYFLLPPLPTQKAIADLLSSLDDKIELLREQNRILEDIGQTIFKEWFGKYSPERPEELPEGWRVGKLEDLAKIEWGNSNMTKSTYLSKGSYQAVSAAGCDGLVDHAEHKYGSFVISAIGENCGTLFMPTGDFTAIKNTLVVSQVEETTSFYLYFGLKIWQLPKRGAAQPFISKGDTENFNIVIPTSIFIDKFEILCNSLYVKIQVNFYQIQTLTRTRDELLPKLMSGEAEV